MARPKSKKAPLKHRWAALALHLEWPRESQMVEWCFDCGALRVKPWQGINRKREPTRYFVPYADFPKWSGGSSNHWSHQGTPPCREIPSNVLVTKEK